jgi:hypothetical protein
MCSCVFIGLQMWIKRIIVLCIVAKCIQIETLSVGYRIMDICISGWYTVNLGTLSSLIVTGWQRWCYGQRWLQFWC